MAAAHKYLMQAAFNKKAPLYRLTLTAEAFALAVLRSKPIAGVQAVARCDGKWDVMVSTATADQLNQNRLEGEHLTDVVVRLLKEPAA
jgi:hypothetical protein